jgi:hypothetical protein
MKEMKKYAKLFDIPLRTAIHIKLRQIVSRMDKEDSLEYAMALCDLGDCLDELLLLEKRESFVHINNYRDTVTEEMKQQALDHPIDRLLEFNNRNQTLAWCHKDSNPSLHWNPAKKKVFCNVCNKAFNAIDVARHVYGLKYYDAIRFLCK